jgi:hypothetical protein
VPLAPSKKSIKGSLFKFDCPGRNERGFVRHSSSAGFILQWRLLSSFTVLPPDPTAKYLLPGTLLQGSRKMSNRHKARRKNKELLFGLHPITCFC